MEIVRKFLTPDEISSPNQRYNATTNVIQYSPDGGTTWVDDPGSDPRHADIFRLPALTGPDAQCDAAARIVAVWQETLDIFLTSVSATQFGTLMLEFLLALIGGTAILGPIGLLIDLMIIVFYALVAIGTANIEAAFTSEVWDGILCIIYCNIGADGQVSAEQRDTIMSEIAAQYPGTVYGTLTQIVNLYGEVLMSNAGVERSETGDCDTCACAWCYPLDFTLDDYDLALSFLNGGTWVSGQGWRTTDTSVSGTRTLLQGVLTLPSGVNLTKAAIVYDWTSSECTACETSGSNFGYGTTDPYEYVVSGGNPCTTAEGTNLSLVIEEPDEVGKISIDFQTSFTCFGGEATVHHINLFGTDPDSLAALVAAYGAAECI